MSALKPFRTGTFETTEPEALADRQWDKDVASGKIHLACMACPDPYRTYCECSNPKRVRFLRCREALNRAYSGAFGRDDYDRTFILNNRIKALEESVMYGW